MTENAKSRNPTAALPPNKFANIPADEEKVITSERQTSINGIDVLIQHWDTMADKALRAVFASADVTHLNDHEILDLVLRSPLTKRNEEDRYRVNLDKSKPGFCCVEFNFDESEETQTSAVTAIRRGEEAQMLRPPPWSANQIAHVLYQYDPMHTCCTEFAGMQSEYDNISDLIRDLISRGRTVAAALREALIFWFAEDLVDRRDRTAVTRDLESVVSPAGALKPFIFVSTKFPPNLSSIEEHGLLFGEQYLLLPEEFFNQSAFEQQAAVKSIITKDMLNAEGNLGELGPIERYILYPPDGYPFVYAVDGEPDAKANDWTIAWRLAHPVDYKKALENAKRSPLHSGYMIYKKQDSNDTACR